MSFIQLHFLVFLIITWIIYYITPQRLKWIILLISSIYFYWTSGWQKIIFAIATCLIAYITSYKVEQIYNCTKYQELEMSEKKEKAKPWCMLGIVAVVLLLIYSKVGQEFVDAVFNYNKESGDVIKIIVPLGISYYTF